MPSVNSSPLPLAFIGVGAMGLHNVRHLLAAGHRVRVHDLEPARVSTATTMGASPAESPSAAVCDAEIVFVCLPSSEAFLAVAGEELLPAARTGQIFVALGTTVPARFRELAERFAARGAHLVDAPVTGGVAGAERASLRMFVGGDTDVVERLRPLLGRLADPAKITHAGPAGSGQILKGVNQLKLALGNAMFAECVAYAERQGARARDGADRLQQRWHRRRRCAARALPRPARAAWRRRPRREVSRAALLPRGRRRPRPPTPPYRRATCLL
jgi:3-hydroxyisobutyrate dehydrogenase-like beta-hydroxyacid dehydrogenase